MWNIGHARGGRNRGIFLGQVGTLRGNGRNACEHRCQRRRLGQVKECAALLDRRGECTEACRPATRARGGNGRSQQGNGGSDFLVGDVTATRKRIVRTQVDFGIEPQRRLNRRLGRRLRQ